jgi:hypothetical protein
MLAFNPAHNAQTNVRAPTVIEIMAVKVYAKLKQTKTGWKPISLALFLATFIMSVVVKHGLLKPLMLSLFLGAGALFASKTVIGKHVKSALSPCFCRQSKICNEQPTVEDNYYLRQPGPPGYNNWALSYLSPSSVRLPWKVVQGSGFTIRYFHADAGTIFSPAI